MTAKEMFELAKAGYKPTEIVEMHKLMKEADVEPETEPEAEPITEPETEPEAEPITEPETEPEIDYKKLYEDTLAKLTAAQEDNSSRNMAGSTKSDEDILADAIRGFM